MPKKKRFPAGAGERARRPTESERPAGGDLLLPGPAWARDISRLDDQVLRRNLEALSAPQQVNLVLSLTWEDRLKIIRNSGNAAEVVKALPPEEVFLTIKGVGEEDAHLLIANTTPSQLRFILDIELWKRDLIDDTKARQWLHHILACGESKVLEFVGTADLELLAAVLRKFLYVIPNEEDAAIPEGYPPIMRDEYFTVLSSIPEETEAIGLFLRIIRQASRDLFLKILFLTHALLEDEAQESALRWRNSRLEESGLLDFEEAVEIYAYIAEDEARRLAGTPSGFYYPREAGEEEAPTFPVLMVDRRTFFYELLRSIDNRSLANKLRREIVFSANRILVADAEEIGDLGSMKKALTRLFSLVNVGLLFLVAGARDDSIRILKDIPIRDVFQIGFSRVADLRQSALQVVHRFWPKWNTEGFGFLGHPREEIVRGLLMRVPQYYHSEGSEAGFRDFETLAEVHATRAALDEIGIVAEACFDKLAIPKPHEAKPELTAVFAVGLEEITFENLLLTGFVNLIASDQFAITPLAAGEVEVMFREVFERDPAGQNVVGKQSRERIFRWFSQAAGFKGAKLQVLAAFVDRSLHALEEEIGRVRSPDDVDPRYVRTLIFKRHSREK